MKSKRLLLILSTAIALAAFLMVRRSLRVAFTPWSYSESEIYSVDFSPNDDCFAVLADVRTEPASARLMVVSRGTGRTLLDTMGSQIFNPCFDQHAKYCAVFIGSELAVFDLSTGSRVFDKQRSEIFNGAAAAMGFTRDSDFLVLEQFSVSFGFERAPSSRITFALPSGEQVNSTASPSFWYGRNLSVDGDMCFAGGLREPTPRVFRRNGDFVGYCYRAPNITNAWFTRESDALLSLHTDGAFIRWDLSDVNAADEVQRVSTSMQPELLDFQVISPLHNENSFVVIDRAGKMSCRKIPK